MKEQRDFFKEVSTVFSKLNQQFQLTKIGKESTLFIPIIYILGTFIQLVRNRMYGLPFYPMSLVQFALITVYICFFLLLYGLVIKSLSMLSKAPKTSVANILVIILYSSFFCYLAVVSLCLIMGSLKSSFIVLGVFLFLSQILKTAPKNSEIMKFSIILIMCVFFILRIPISLGGFKGEQVTFCEYTTDQEFTFDYYGHHEGMYYFTKDEEIYLVPTDSGYIKYKNK